MPRAALRYVTAPVPFALSHHGRCRGLDQSGERSYAIHMVEPAAAPFPSRANRDPESPVERVAPTPGPLQTTCGNLLLQRMDATEYALLAPFFHRVPLEVGAQLARAGEAIETVCFLEGGVAGFLDVLDDGRKLAVGLVGREGFVGWPLLMGDGRWPYDVVLRGTGTTTLQIAAHDFALAAGHSATLQRMMLRFASTFVAQMGRTIVSNLIHSVERRAARWILLYHDRLAGDEIALTHEELSAMLGVRRASITDALHVLEGERAIRGLRGRVVVRDRALLEAFAGEAYGFAESEYRRLIAPPSPAS